MLIVVYQSEIYLCGGSRLIVVYCLLITEILVLLYLHQSCKIFENSTTQYYIKGGDWMDVWGFIQTPILGRKLSRLLMWPERSRRSTRVAKVSHLRKSDLSRYVTLLHSAVFILRLRLRALLITLPDRVKAQRSRNALHKCSSRFVILVNFSQQRYSSASYGSYGPRVSPYRWRRVVLR